ncbi:Parallel beta-helix repeat [Syntrophobacter fumaroxidans MPOB]|uniref:Parallel beta-helix repeat n=1 Tax=Syntrophobacter fumaroxidans (strain DSM 10017 / MPOB) TaxID=335543 RepID=A0LMA1_SYNFM|nr:Parallel beta-helix repeat [Syntrophobacter fumaroxidans MPOB]
MWKGETHVRTVFKVRTAACLSAAIALLLSVIGAAPVFSATYYVAVTGSDGNPGTRARPWRTVQKAARTVPPGSVVYVRAGVYHERVEVSVSGTADGGGITFRNYPHETAVLDGTGLVVPLAENGMFFIDDRDYITVKGFEIRNYRTSRKDAVPAGVHVRGASHHIRILNNRIHHIEHNGTLETGTDAFGIAVFGTRGAQSVNNLVIDGNELYALKLGSSESLVVNGNVEHFRITNNVVHDNNNIGIVAIGFEGVSPSEATDQARDGVIANNTVYRIDSYGNPAYGDDRSADGIYVDGGRNIVIERNIVHHCNIGIELASEHFGKATRYVTVRNNFVYLNDITGISMGGYDTRRGSAEHCTVVNNTLFRNDRLQWGNGELCLQYKTRNNVIENNIFHANAQSVLISNAFSDNSGNVVDYNVFYAPDGPAESVWQWKKVDYTGFAAYRTATGNDLHSRFVNPRLVGTSLPDLHLRATSPAVDAGRNLAVAGTKDIDGQPRIHNHSIDIGADEVQ